MLTWLRSVAGRLGVRGRVAAAVAAVATMGAAAAYAPGLLTRTPGLDEGERVSYQYRWDRMVLDEGRRPEIAAAVERMIRNKAKYVAVSSATGVLWYITATIDELEAGGGCKAHLHNGDSLSERTIHVPKGQPESGSPPFSWYVSALDALESSGWTRVDDKTMPSLAWKLEEYNGWGYQKRGLPSPYLFAGSDQYRKGKYVKDGVYDADAVSRQLGALVLLKALEAASQIKVERWAPQGSR